MLEQPNALQWRDEPGHYEVYYVTLTDPVTGVGAWLRYTMIAPSSGAAPTAALWFLTMDPRQGRAPTLGRKQTFPIEALEHRDEPFELRIGSAVLSNTGMSGEFDDVAWDLRWTPASRGYEHVHPVLRRTGLAKTVLVLPQPDLEIDGRLRFGDEELRLSGARGGQAHLWGSKHAGSWAWVHCNDFVDRDGAPVPGAVIDAVSVVVPRFGREFGPSTPVVGSIDGEDFCSTSPLRVLTNPSTFALTGWRFEAVAGERKVIAQVSAERAHLGGVTYYDPDGERAYCYNSEIATMYLHLYERTRQVGGWTHRGMLIARGRAHFEYAQRVPVPGLELLTT